MIVSKILNCLPAFIEYEGITFVLGVFTHDAETVRICYVIDRVKDDSPHKDFFSIHKQWKNPFWDDQNTAINRFLYQIDDIGNDDDFINAIDQMRFFLIQKGFSVPGMLLEDLTYGEVVTFNSNRLGTVQLSSVGLGETMLEYYGRLMHDWAGLVIGDAAYPDQGSKQHYQYKAGQIVWLSKKFFSKL